jgi:hypothetical protein
MFQMRCRLTTIGNRTTLCHRTTPTNASAPSPWPLPNRCPASAAESAREVILCSDPPRFASAVVPSRDP